MNEALVGELLGDGHLRFNKKGIDGKPVTQFHFASKALISLSKIYSQWYIWSDTANKFIKIVPSNIGELLTPLGLAHWIMGDGYWDNHSKTVVICTDNFTLAEVELLIIVLKTKFNLTATVQRRIKSNKEICWRIRFSSKSENIFFIKNFSSTLSYSFNAL